MMLRSPKSTMRSANRGLKLVIGLMVFALFVSNILYFSAFRKQEIRTLAELNHAVVEKATATLLKGKLGKAVHGDTLASSVPRSEEHHGVSPMSSPHSAGSWEHVVSKLAENRATRMVKSETTKAAKFHCMDLDKDCAET